MKTATRGFFVAFCIAMLAIMPALASADEGPQNVLIEVGENTDTNTDTTTEVDTDTDTDADTDTDIGTDTSGSFSIMSEESEDTETDTDVDTDTGTDVDTDADTSNDEESNTDGEGQPNDPAMVILQDVGCGYFSVAVTGDYQASQVHVGISATVGDDFPVVYDQTVDYYAGFQLSDTFQVPDGATGAFLYAGDPSLNGPHTTADIDCASADTDTTTNTGGVWFSEPSVDCTGAASFDYSVGEGQVDFSLILFDANNLEDIIATPLYDTVSGAGTFRYDFGVETGAYEGIGVEVGIDNVYKETSIHGCIDAGTTAPLEILDDQTGCDWLIFKATSSQFDQVGYEVDDQDGRLLGGANLALETPEQVFSVDVSGLTAGHEQVTFIVNYVGNADYNLMDGGPVTCDRSTDTDTDTDSDTTTDTDTATDTTTDTDTDMATDTDTDTDTGNSVVDDHQIDNSTPYGVSQSVLDVLVQALVAALISALAIWRGMTWL